VAAAAVAAGVVWVANRPPKTRSVIFVVLDNVRADRLALCGHDRPTSANLEAFARSGDHSCQAYVPGAWTLPSHASFFTGLTVPEHGAHFSGNQEALVLSLQAHPLPEGIPTLAEKFKERGYRTVMVSANPVLSPVSGLQRGFDQHVAAPRFGKLYDDRLIDKVSKQLTWAQNELEPGQPLFLFVNISDAHIPWKTVPDGIDWVGPRPRVNSSKEEGAPMNRLVNGLMTEPERADYEAHLDDVYDYAVFRADRTFGKLMDVFATHRLLDDVRMVVTSDHGEFLGEQGMVSHCCATHEANARVAFLTRGVNGKLPSVMSAMSAHEMLLTGEIPTLPIQMAGDPNPSLANVFTTFGSETWVSEWRGQNKFTWREGASTVVDLGSDPDEERASSAEMPDTLGVFLEDFQRSLAREGDEDVLGEALRALGYAE
jgi:arylsulfatase A-like enzyme